MRRRPSPRPRTHRQAQSTGRPATNPGLRPASRPRRTAALTGRVETRRWVMRPRVRGGPTSPRPRRPQRRRLRSRQPQPIEGVDTTAMSRTTSTSHPFVSARGDMVFLERLRRALRNYGPAPLRAASDRPKSLRRRVRVPPRFLEARNTYLAEWIRIDTYGT